MGKPAKHIITYAELLEKIQDLLACYPTECRNIHIDSIEVNLEQVDGANWHVTRHRRSGIDNDWAECWGKILPELRLLRSSYDVVKD